MAKYKNTKRYVTGVTITTPSQFGSHSSMVSDAEYELNENEVVCEDERGIYITERSRLDTGLADPNRYNNRRLPSGF